MPVEFPHGLPLSSEEAEQLWQRVVSLRSVPDGAVVVRVVSKEEIRQLKSKYKGVNEPTNVLTFSYPEEGFLEGGHDIALCLEVAQEEARLRGVSTRDYVAWLLVHSFLHASGLDHEVGDGEAKIMSDMERSILQAAGFTFVP